MKLSLLFYSLISASCLLLTPVLAAPSEFRLDSVLASAGTWANMRKSNGSVRAESETLLQRAEKELQSIVSRGETCKRGTILFESTPNFRLNGDSERAECGELSAKTERNPITYTGLTFDSIEEFASWFGDFSQGKGKEGKDLYVRCPGSCSPGYATEIEVSSGKYAVTARVHCGLPRDKSDNQFKLSARVLCQ